VLCSEVNKCSKNLQSVKIKWPLLYDSTSLDLEINAETSNEHLVELYVFENIDHRLLYDKLHGKGVELGPGNNPRLVSNKERSVEYIEAHSLEDWYANYNKNREDQGLWHLYKVAKAHELQYQDCSLDFVFGAHVLEHLINPIGHIARWYRLLKKGGLVSHIIPNMRGCFEYRSWPTSVNEWIADYEANVFEPDYKHYKNYCGYHGGNPKVYFEEKRSVHYSFFSEENLSWLLQYVCENVGYSNYSIQWSANHFDVSFVLKK
jgi:predicted SAM-dependent methyltransferase